MNMHTYINKYCDEEARYTAEFELRDFGVIDGSVVVVDVSCFAQTRKKARADLRKTLEAIVSALQKSIEELK